MPYPNPGEPKKSYLKRFMESPEANQSFPDQKQRYAVANSMFRQKHQVKRLRDRSNKT